MRWLSVLIAVSGLALAGCSSMRTGDSASSDASLGRGESAAAPIYQIRPGDQLQVFVWRNPELTVTVPVRPDGRISVPLIPDLVASGKTATQLADEISSQLKKYIQDPTVTVMVTNFVGPFSQQVRVVGEAAQPQAIPYRANMSVLDVMIAAGGLTRYAAGNRAVIARSDGAGHTRELHVRLDDLLKDGDLTANASMLPGDVLIVPQSYF
jgi:polysaccharide export outer membrane protein